MGTELSPVRAKSLIFLVGSLIHHYTKAASNLRASKGDMQLLAAYLATRTEPEYSEGVK